MSVGLFQDGVNRGRKGEREEGGEERAFRRDRGEANQRAASKIRAARSALHQRRNRWLKRQYFMRVNPLLADALNRIRARPRLSAAAGAHCPFIAVVSDVHLQRGTRHVN